MNIGTYLREKRIEHGYTMKELGAKIGVSEATVSRWERGQISGMRRSRIEALARILEIDPVKLIGINTEDGLEHDYIADFHGQCMTIETARNDSALTKRISNNADALEVLDAYRVADESTQRAIRRILNLKG